MRRGVTTLETLIGMALFVLALALVWGFVRQAGRTGAKVETVHAAVVHAELAMGAVAADLRSMLPPDPSRGGAPYRVSGDGRALAFYRVEEVRGALRAKPVRYEARATPAGNLTLHRDGQRMANVLLAGFKVEVLAVQGAENMNGQPLTLPRAAGANPRISVSIEGVSLDRPRAELPADAFHPLRQMFAVPETSPAATMDLPPVARELARKAIQVEGSLPEL